MAEFDPQTKRVRARNEIMKKLAAENHFPVDDLFALVENGPAFYAGGDGVHLAAKGITAQAVQVAKMIRDQLPTR